MAKIKKIVTAGPLVKECIYSRVGRSDTPAARSAKQKASSAAQQRMNEIHSWQKLELMLAANYLPGDLVVVLTYDDRHLPRDRKEAQARLKYFRAKLAKWRKAHGQELVIFWNEEHFHDHRDELQRKRWHHHCVINATGDDYAALQKLWGQGLVLIAPLEVTKERNYETLARYMCKEARDKPGQRSWSYTRNARKPEVETFRVSDDTTVQAPRGAILLESVNEHSQYGSWQYVKYIGAHNGTVPRAKRRAKRRR